MDIHVVYLSGPISLGGELTEAEQEGYKQRFHDEQKRLEGMGFEVINPLLCPPCDSWEAYMRHGISSVCKADAIAVLPGWHLSRGAMVETFIANILKIPICPVEEIS